MSTPQTILELRDHYLAVNKRIKWSTAQLTRRALTKIAHALGNLDLKGLTLEHGEQFQLWLCSRYASRTTVNMNMKIVRPVFRYAMRRGWVSEDIFAIPLMRVTEERERIYEPQEVQAMLSAANEMWRIRIWLAKSCGLRRSEVLNLTFSDVDSVRKLIHVQPKKQTNRTWAWEPKGKTCRSLPMPDIVAELIQARRKHLPPEQEYVNLSDTRYWRVLNLQRQDRLTERIRLCPDENFSIPFKKILQRARVSDGTFHDLRRTYGTEMAEAGVPQHILAYLMGHADTKTTERYYVKLRRDRAIESVRGLTEHTTVGVSRFERPTSCSPSKRSNQAELHPETIGLNY